MRQPILRIRALVCAFTLIAAVLPSIAHGDEQLNHVLLLSIDGLHAQDVERYVRLNPSSALAQLTNMASRIRMQRPVSHPIHSQDCSRW